MELRGTRRYAPWVFLLPYLAVTLVFFCYPLIDAAVLAFHQTNGASTRVWVGLDNFRFVLSDGDFWIALRNTAVYTFASLFVQLPLSLGLALLLAESSSRAARIVRLLLFSPQLVGQIFVGIIFMVMLAPRYGLVNQFVFWLVGGGLDMEWLGKPALIMPALVLTSLWMYVGFNMIYFLAALQNVDKTLLEAARIDGANKWQVFKNVTIPAIKPVAIFVVVTSTIGSFQLFELSYALVGPTGGPQSAGLTIVGYLYNTAFSSGDLGAGSAVGWILTFIIFLVGLIQIRLTGSHKDG
jgi:ABC-type sugar transport system permease subunit